MNKLKTLVLMQLHDKIDLSWMHNKEQTIRKIVFGVLKFLIVGILTFAILYVAKLLNLFYYSEAPYVITLVLFISLTLSIISCTVELMKTLYFSDDNKVLITLPVNTNYIFISKIIVYYIYEIKKAFGFLIPIILGCVILLLTVQGCHPYILFTMWIPLIFIISLPVLIGSLLSIPLLYIYRFLKKNPIIESILVTAILAVTIIGVVYLISLIPENIDLINQWDKIGKNIRNFIDFCDKKLVLSNHLIRIIIGQKSNITSMYSFTIWTIIKFLILILVNALLILAGYLISRPMFFRMMAKNFEQNKSLDNTKRNKKRSVFLTFINKEWLINIRSVDISLNYLAVYVIVPILILLLNKLYAAMDTKQLGDVLSYTFNVLLICLPMLASNSLVATYYSREGRAGYMKKTKPVWIAYPLFAKLFFNMFFSTISVFITSYFFGVINRLPFNNILLFNFAILFVHFAHMVYSAMLDIMNPQNEQYATVGTEVSNPNENKSTVYAFIISFAFSLFTYKLLSESLLNTKALTNGLLKMMLIGLGMLICVCILFMKRIKVFYTDASGRQ